MVPSQSRGAPASELAATVITTPRFAPATVEPIWVTAKVTNSQGRVFEFNLTTGQSIYLRPRLWLELENFSPDAVVGVMASHAYESSDYINSIEDL